MAESKQKPKHKRRWLRFSLRTFLISVTVVVLCLSLIWYAINYQRVVNRLEQSERLGTGKPLSIYLIDDHESLQQLKTSDKAVVVADLRGAGYADFTGSFFYWSAIEQTSKSSLDIEYFLISDEFLDQFLDYLNTIETNGLKYDYGSALRGAYLLMSKNELLYLNDPDTKDPNSSQEIAAMNDKIEQVFGQERK